MKRAADSISWILQKVQPVSQIQSRLKFIGYVQRSALEVVNCLYLANKRNYIDQIEFDKFYNELERLVAKIQAFKNSLK